MGTLRLSPGRTHARGGGGRSAAIARALEHAAATLGEAALLGLATESALLSVHPETLGHWLAEAVAQTGDVSASVRAAAGHARDYAEAGRALDQLGGVLLEALHWAAGRHMPPLDPHLRARVEQEAEQLWGEVEAEGDADRLALASLGDAIGSYSGALELGTPPFPEQLLDQLVQATGAVIVWRALLYVLLTGAEEASPGARTAKGRANG